MIISHEHRFIFIENRKTGSAGPALICGPDDVLAYDGALGPLLPRYAVRLFPDGAVA